jgi:hypothetical protein
VERRIGTCVRAMTTLRRFTADDLFKFANVNLDHLTETVGGVRCVGALARGEGSPLTARESIA